MGNHQQQSQTPTADAESGVPKYMQLANYIRHEIRSGRLVEGQKLRSVRDLAETFGATKVTVCQSMKQLTVEGLVEPRGKSGYFVRRNRPPTAAIVFDRNVFDSSATHYAASLIREVEACLHNRGWWLCNPYFNTSPSAWDVFIQDIKDRKFDAVIVGSGMFDAKMLNLMHQVGVVSVGIYHLDGFTYYVCDNKYEMSLRAVNEFVSMGARRIGLIHGPVEFKQERGPALGYMDALKAHGIAYDPSIVRCIPYVMELATKTFHEIYRSDPGIDALLVSDELLMQGVLRGIFAEKLSIPGDLVVASQTSDSISDPFIIPTIQLRTCVSEQAFKLVETAVAASVGTPINQPKFEVSPTIINPYTNVLRTSAIGRGATLYQVRQANSNHGDLRNAVTLQAAGIK